ncbi:hypothetical protein J6590_004416 [Homalodisca vitripennis]|nr:hypothetical protein J6590_004416 [Homalodisca vitripennis]
MLCVNFTNSKTQHYLQKTLHFEKPLKTPAFSVCLCNEKLYMTHVKDELKYNKSSKRRREGGVPRFLNGTRCDPTTHRPSLIYTSTFLVLPSPTSCRNVRLQGSHLSQTVLPATLLSDYFSPHADNTYFPSNSNPQGVVKIFLVGKCRISNNVQSVSSQSNYFSVQHDKFTNQDDFGTVGDGNSILCAPRILKILSSFHSAITHNRKILES